jgi:hypothetical protein
VQTKLRLGLRFLGAFAALLSVAAIVLTSYALVIESQAKGLLRDFVTLRPGISTGFAAQQFAQRHRALITEPTSPCNRDSCSMGFRIENKWLSRLRLEPLAMFEVDFSVRNGKVTWMDATLYREMPIFPTFGGSAGMVEETVELPRGCRVEHYCLPTPIGKPYISVSLDSHVTPTQWQRAYDFSFGCLVKPGGGCNLPCDYLPLAWQDWKASIAESGWPMNNFNRTYPNNARCKQ